MLKEELKKNEIAAMKARDKQTVSVLRLVNAEIKAYEVNERKDATDEIVIKIIEKQLKQVKETLQYAIQLNDESKIDEGNFAITLLTPYLPAQLSEDEVKEMLKEIISNGNYLKQTGQQKVLRQFDERLNKTIRHRELKRNVSYRKLMRLECYKLIKHLMSDKEYEPFKIWW